jgi:pimeloyl-ACP methyl ester carboxylesterase
MTLDGGTGPGDTVDASPRVCIEDRGTGSFMFSGAVAVRDHPIRVWYIAPDGDLSTADILFVMPGAARDAQDYQTDWEPLVQRRHVLVIIPDFDEADYPVAAYNLGNLVGPDGDANLRDRWSFTVIDALFDRVVAHIHSHAKDFMMFGHSAGAQFVHRFMEFTPNRVRTAVVANAGWYTMPDDSKAFPYGLRGVPQDEEGLADSYSANLTVLLGADDNNADDRLLRHDAGSDAQGSSRLERGLTFYLTARKSAEEHSLTFRWHLRVVPGIGHDHTAMARAAAPILFGRSE